MYTESRIHSLNNQRFDVVVIGGGVNGAAGAQQLAARGFNVLLVEKNDFGSGSSSRSSRLLHCGLRYLAPGSSLFEFVRHPSRLAVGMKMARQAIDARHELVQTGNNRVVKSRLYFPIYKNGPYAGWQLDLAFKLLEIFNKGKTPLNYRRIKADEIGETPLVNMLHNQNHIDSVAVYDEYQMAWPERITMDSVLDAARQNANVLNYTTADITKHDGKSWHIKLTDNTVQDSATIYTNTVVNAAGIWIDEVFEPHRTGKPPKVTGTKGAHIAVQLPSSCRGIGVATLNSKNEPFYCLPWGDLHYIGPTETLYKGDKDRIVTTPADLQFLLSEANHLFPSLKLTESDVVHTWSGVRPLTWDERMPQGNRNRVIHNMGSDGMPNTIAITAGPVMTYRSAGTEIADAVEHISGQKAFNNAQLNYSSYVPSPTDDSVLQALKGDIPEPSWLTRVLEDEFVVHLSDIIFRRTGLVWYRQFSKEDLSQIAAYCGPRLGWSTDDIAREVSLCMAELNKLQHVQHES